jgi:outer membrane receptor protein involved in Fe transport
LIDRFGSIDPTEGGNTERYNANVLLTHQFTNTLIWENQAYYTPYIFNLYSDFTFYLLDPINGDEINQAEKRNLFGYSSKLIHKKIYRHFTLTSTYGAGIRYDATDSSKLAHVVKRQFIDYIQSGNIKETNAFLYIQQQLTAGKLFIDGGIRFDYLHFDYFNYLTAQQLPNQHKSIINPKLNIQYTFNSNIQLYIKAGKGFHSNDTRIVTANEGHEILPAAYGADIGIIFKPSAHMFFNIAAWVLTSRSGICLRWR